MVGFKSLLALLGTRDKHLRQIREGLGVEIHTHRDELRVTGPAEAVEQATRVLEELKTLVLRQGGVRPTDVDHLIMAAKTGQSVRHAARIDVFNPKRQIQPQTPGQVRYVEALKTHELVFCIGPAGTGKTYLAVAMAVAALKAEMIRKIVMVRPAVEAGESLGFLPGDLQAKINPYLRPLLDALGEMMDFEQIKQYTERDRIEMIPLAYMRGRTLNEAFIILDEAQNTTVSQMKMFLTRMGHGSRIVVSGDATQIDLPDHRRSGLADAVKRLGDIEGVAHVKLTQSDVVRHRLVQAIVQAYEETGSDK